MRGIGNLSTAQRAVLVVALGAAFLVLGSYLTSLGQRELAAGWYGYATPGELGLTTGWPAWLRLILWLALACLWAVISLRLLRPAALKIARPQDHRADGAAELAERADDANGR